MSSESVARHQVADSARSKLSAYLLASECLHVQAQYLLHSTSGSECAHTLTLMSMVSEWQRGLVVVVEMEAQSSPGLVK